MSPSVSTFLIIVRDNSEATHVCDERRSSSVWVLGAGRSLSHLMTHHTCVTND